jgi:hypothetical protein
MDTTKQRFLILLGDLCLQCIYMGQVWKQYIYTRLGKKALQLVFLGLAYSLTIIIHNRKEVKREYNRNTLEIHIQKQIQ